jgi:hypothetical protein
VAARCAESGRPGVEQEWMSMVHSKVEVRLPRLMLMTRHARKEQTYVSPFAFVVTVGLKEARPAQ